MSHTPQVLFIFPYIETVIEWLALSATPLLIFVCLLDRWYPQKRCADSAAVRTLETQGGEVDSA